MKIRGKDIEDVGNFSYGMFSIFLKNGTEVRMDPEELVKILQCSDYNAVKSRHYYHITPIKTKPVKKPRGTYITYGDGTKVVWGYGKSEAASRKDAIGWLKCFYYDKEIDILKKKLKTVKCKPDLIKYVDDNGGGSVPFEIKRGVAVLCVDVH